MSSIRALFLGPALALGLGLVVADVAIAQSGPTCGPTVLDNSAVQLGAVTVSPLPGSRDATPQTQISFLGLPAQDIGTVDVTASRSGVHHGRLAAYSQGDGASFLPKRPFVAGERVSVRARVRVSGVIHELVDQFAIASQDQITTTPETIHQGSPADAQSFRSRPQLHPPVLTVTASSPAVAPGDLFVAPYTGPGEAGPEIVEPDGALVWFDPLPRDTFATNFRVQRYDGQPVLTWWQGDISVHGFGLGEGLIDNGDYATIAHVRAGNGLREDLHELQITPQGTALITAYDPIYCNLSAVGGPADGAVTDGVFQEIDVKTGLVMYEWTSLDHVGMSESYALANTSSTADPFDFFHINSINLDQDGSLLVSARNTWTIYRIDSASGQIIWQLGGKHSSFTQATDTRTAWQHDPRELANGDISVFDNGAAPNVHGQSRALVLSLNLQSATATLVSQLTHDPVLIAESQGNVEALENGDSFVGWGQEPDLSEFNVAGQLLFDAHFPAYDQNYRSFRFPWTGTPTHRPAYTLLAGAAHGGTVYASWNGATLVAAWRVLAGATPGALAVVAQSARAGFETAIALPAGTGGPYLAVQALGSAGQVLGTSAVSAQAAL
jgi:hypothetical protein